MDFNQMAGELFGLYEEGDYRRALDLVIREAPRFPEARAQTAFWRACLHAVLGEAGEALRVLREAVDAGLWFAPSKLRMDPDLAPLQGLPVFEELVRICEQRRDALQARAVTSRITLEAGGAGPAPLLLALHGNNGNAARTVEYWKGAAASGWIVALPQSSQVGGPDVYVWDDWDRGEREVRQHYEELCARLPVDRDRVVVAGFSMGGGLAIWLALGALPVRGFIAVAPWMPNVDVLRAALDAQRPEGLRGCVIVGDRDKQCLRISRALVAMLDERGAACRLEVCPGLGHAYPAHFDPMLREALAFVAPVR